MENVTGLAYVTPELLERILDAYRFDNGRREYYAAWKILSAGNYGVAQNRKRVIVIAVRRDIAERVGIDSDDKVLEAFPRPTHGMVSIRSALDGLEQSFEDERPYLNSIRLSQLPKLLRQLPKCPPKPRRLKNVKTNFTLVRCSWDCAAPTLVITGQKPDGLSGAIHPELDRKFTIPELKRLFGLPDDFILTGTIQQAVECICNMVPPFLTNAVAQSIYDRVLRPLKEQDPG
jgi:site-specific DNA-cytosine methylase